MESVDRLQQIFPETLRLGGGVFLTPFLQEKLAAHYFPLFLKSQSAAKNLQEMSHYEAVKWQLAQDVPPTLSALDFLQVNPSFQWLELQENILALWRIPQDKNVHEFKLNSGQAFLLETLNLDRKFHLTQLLEWMRIHFPKANLSEAEWSKELKTLLELQLVF